MGHWPEYEAVGLGQPAPAPFCWRWLVPYITRADRKEWASHTRSMLFASFFAFALLMKAWGFSPPQIMAGLLLWGLWPSIQQQPRRHYLPDTTALIFVMLSATAFLCEAPLLVGVALAIAAGATRETAPLYIAAGSLNPFALAGLLGAGWWRKSSKEQRQPHLHGNPLTLFKRHGIPKIILGLPHDYFWKIGPAALALLYPKAWLPLLLAVSSMLISTDKIRVLAHAAPFLLIGAVAVTPLPMLPMLVYFGAVCSNVWEN